MSGFLEPMRRPYASTCTCPLSAGYRGADRILDSRWSVSLAEKSEIQVQWEVLSQNKTNNSKQCQPLDFTHQHLNSNKQISVSMENFWCLTITSFCFSETLTWIVLKNWIGNCLSSSFPFLINLSAGRCWGQFFGVRVLLLCHNSFLKQSQLTRKQE